MGLYIETRIRADLDLLWERTQRPDLHQRWDLRFTQITYLPRDAPKAPQRFRYATRLLPGLLVTGTGVCAGERFRPDGTWTSALRFGSPHPLCLLARGRGYWRYVPQGRSVTFGTGYDYAARWGAVGRLADRLVFRPLMTWATAWSFDRLRLWCERGVRPERALRQAWGEVAARVVAVALAAALAGVGPLLALVAFAALLLPPLPSTPSARRVVHHHRPTNEKR